MFSSVMALRSRATAPKDGSTAVVGLAFLANGAGIGSTLSRLPELRLDLGLSSSAFGLAMFGMGLGTALSVACAARFCTRYGSGTMVRVGLGLLTLGTMLVGTSFSFAMLFASLTILGLGNGTLDVSMSTQELSRKVRLGRPRLPLLYGVYNVGGLAGAGGGAVAAVIGFGPGPHLLCVAALLTLILVVPLRLLCDDRSRSIRPGGGARSISRIAVVMAGMILILVIAQGLIPAWGGVYILSSISAHSAFGGLSYAVYSGAMAMGRLSGDYVVGVVGATRVLIVSPLVAATGMLAAALARSPVVALSSFALVGIGLSCVGPLVYTVAGNSIGKSVSGGVASVAAVGQIGEMIGPAIIGRSAEHVTFRGVFLGASVMTLMLSALAWLALFASRSPMHLPFVRSSP